MITLPTIKFVLALAGCAGAGALVAAVYCMWHAQRIVDRAARKSKHRQVIR